MNRLNLVLNNIINSQPSIQTTNQYSNIYHEKDQITSFSSVPPPPPCASPDELEDLKKNYLSVQLVHKLLRSYSSLINVSSGDNLQICIYVGITFEF